MKRICALLIAAALILTSTTSHAQNSRTVPKWVSEKGYWVVESKQKDKLNHTIRFYNNDNELVYSETITSARLNPAKRKVRMKLKTILESAVLAWQQRNMRPFPHEQSLVKAAL